MIRFCRPDGGVLSAGGNVVAICLAEGMPGRVLARAGEPRYGDYPEKPVDPSIPSNWKVEEGVCDNSLGEILLPQYIAHAYQACYLVQLTASMYKDAADTWAKMKQAQADLTEAKETIEQLKQQGAKGE